MERKEVPAQDEGEKELGTKGATRGKRKHKNTAKFGGAAGKGRQQKSLSEGKES